MVKKLSHEDPLETDRLLTAQEVASRLNVSRTTIYWLIKHSELPTVRIGHALRFRREDVEAYIRKRSALLRKPKSRYQ